MKLFDKDEELSLVKAVINHSKDLVQEIKPTINNYVQKHNKFYSDINEDEIYEQVMIEMEEDNKVKSTWAKALAQSDGNKDKAESLYIKLRVDSLVQEKLEILEKERKKAEEASVMYEIIRKEREKREKEERDKENIKNYLNRKKINNFNQEKVENIDEYKPKSIFEASIILIKFMSIIIGIFIALVIVIETFK